MELTDPAGRVHMIGLGGAGMSALGRLLRGKVTELTGSDLTANSVVAALCEEGFEVWVGHRPDRVTGRDGWVIRSAAVPPTDPEVVECERRGFTSLLYAEAVGRISEGNRTLAIAGTHGKTTTTALTVAALRGGGLDPSHLIGGEVPDLGGNGYGGRDDLFVVEACEFNRSFHQLRPDGAAILNLDHDHFDCYPSTAELVDAFAGYAARVRPGGHAYVEESVPSRVVDSVSSDVRVLRVGSGLFADVRASLIEDDLGRYSFVPVIEGGRLPRVSLSLSGRFQIQNALFALALVHFAGGDVEGACTAVSDFAGVRRRFELRTGTCGGHVINDYAHHPQELRAVFRAARRRFPGRPLFAVFQPHQHRRTLSLFDDFAAVLADADRCLLAEIYGAREEHESDGRVSAADLADAVESRGTRCEFAENVADLPRMILEMRHPEDLVLILGAGDIDLVVDDLVAAI